MVFHVLADVALEAVPHEPFDVPKRHGRGLEIALGLRARGGLQIFRRDERIGVADRVRLCGLQEIAGVEQTQRARRADQARQHPRSSARIGHQAAMREIPREARAVRDDTHVALAGEFRAHADGEAIDRADHWLGALQERPPLALFLGRAAHAARFARDGREIGQIRARAERAARAGDDQHAHAIVFADLRDLFGEGAQHRIGHGVALFGAVDRQRADAVAIDLELDVVSRHGVPPRTYFFVGITIGCEDDRPPSTTIAWPFT